jgi:RHS repeat-associated protein
MVAELAPNGTQTRYYAPNGELLYFEVQTATTDQPAVYGSAYYGQNYYGPLVYQVLTDGAGSVRRILDAYNNVVSSIDMDSYGNPLPSTSDSLNFPYYYVGTLGVRWDIATSLYFMRDRWYDPTLQRFLSRDRGSTTNSYIYTANSPAEFIDPFGLDLVVYVYGSNPKPLQMFLSYLSQATGIDFTATRIGTGPYDSDKYRIALPDVVPPDCWCGTSGSARQLLSQIINSSVTTRVDLLWNDPAVDVGMYAGQSLTGNQQIDMADAQAIQDVSPPHGIGAVLHELNEAYTYFKALSSGQGKVGFGNGRYPFRGAHGQGIQAENRYYSDIGQGGCRRSDDPIKWNGQNGVNFDYTTNSFNIYHNNPYGGPSTGTIYVEKK